MKKIILALFLILGVLFFPITTYSSELEKENKFVTLVNPVRFSEYNRSSPRGLGGGISF